MGNVDQGFAGQCARLRGKGDGTAVFEANNCGQSEHGLRIVVFGDTVSEPKTALSLLPVFGRVILLGCHPRKRLVAIIFEVGTTQEANDSCRRKIRSQTFHGFLEQRFDLREWAQMSESHGEASHPVGVPRGKVCCVVRLLIVYRIGKWQVRSVKQISLLIEMPF